MLGQTPGKAWKHTSINCASWYHPSRQRPKVAATFLQLGFQTQTICVQRLGGSIQGTANELENVAVPALRIACSWQKGQAENGFLSSLSFNHGSLHIGAVSDALHVDRWAKLGSHILVLPNQTLHMEDLLSLLFLKVKNLSLTKRWRHKRSVLFL